MKMTVKKKVIFSFIGLSVLCLGGLAFLFADAFYDSNFRSMQDEIIADEDVDLTGLRELRASGGFSVGYRDIKRRLSHVDGTKIIIDGMSSDHGYVREVPITMLGYHMRRPPDYRHLLRRLFLTGTFDKREDLIVKPVDEARKFGLSYENVKIISKTVLTDENVEQILNLFENAPSDAWFHFHCHHGKGRTSTMVVMLDIVKNAPQVALQDIVKRHSLLGSTNFFDTKVWKRGTYSKDLLEARKKFIEDFYNFVVQRKQGGIQNWTQWRRAHPA